MLVKMPLHCVIRRNISDSKLNLDSNWLHSIVQFDLSILVVCKNMEMVISHKTADFVSWSHIEI